MTGRRRPAVALAFALALAACGIDVDAVPPPGGDAAAPTTSTTSTTAPPSSTTTTEADDDEDAGGAPGGLDPSTIECLMPDDPGALFGGEEITGPAAEQVQLIADAVEAERELTFEREVSPTFVTGEEIAERVREMNERSYPADEADVDDRLLTALGAIPPDMDLRQTFVELTAGQVAGFYEPDTGELVVAADDPGEPLPATEQVTVAHELDHALTDQRLDLPVDDDEVPGGSDADLAALALIEGDATVLMQRFALEHIGLPALLEAEGSANVGAAQEQLAAAPHFLRSRLLFPYVEGLRFVCELLVDGGWEAVDAAYEALPASTAQVLFPERYGDPAVDAASELGTPGEGWELAREDELGAAGLLWLLEAPGDDESRALDDPRERVADWAADRLAVHTRGDETAVAVSMLQGGDAEDGALCDTVVEWYRAAFPDAADAGPAEGEALAVDGPTQDAVVRCDDATVDLAIAPDLATARTMVG